MNAEKVRMGPVIRKPPGLSLATFRAIRKVVYEQSGIHLGDQKQALVQARLIKRLRALGLDDFESYLAYLIEGKSDNEGVYLINAISTNVTSFFREDDQFGFLTQTVNRALQAGQTRFRFWSAACSSGEEPYSMAISLLDQEGMEKVDIKILATDLCTDALEAGREGQYKEEKLKGVKQEHRSRYFIPSKSGASGRWQVAPFVRHRVVFARHNLHETPYPMNGPLDGIFCRNVMIYFDNPVRKKLLAECKRLLRAGGHLYVGRAESLAGIMSGLKLVGPSVYQKTK